MRSGRAAAAAAAVEVSHSCRTGQPAVSSAPAMTAAACVRAATSLPAARRGAAKPGLRLRLPAATVFAAWKPCTAPWLLCWCGCSHRFGTTCHRTLLVAFLALDARSGISLALLALEERGAQPLALLDVLCTRLDVPASLQMHSDARFQSPDGRAAWVHDLFSCAHNADVHADQPYQQTTSASHEASSHN